MIRWIVCLRSVVCMSLPTMGSAGDSRKENSLIADLKFVRIPKGTFWMGWNSITKVCKQVEIREDFELAAYTVTQEQWLALMGNNPSHFSRKGDAAAAVKDDGYLKFNESEIILIVYNRHCKAREKPKKPCRKLIAITALCS